MNSEINNSSAFFLKKLYIYFTIVIVILVQYSQIKSRIFKIPIYFQRKDYFSILAYLYKYMNSISEDKQKEMANPDNFYYFTYESLIKIISDVFISARMITKEEFENMNEFLQQIYDNSFFLKKDYLFFYDEFILMNIDEKKYPVDLNISLEVSELSQKKRVSVVQGNNSGINSSIISTGPKYLIPKSALIEEFEKIPSEIYNILLFGISNNMLKDKREMYVKQFFNIICINNIHNKIEQINSNDIKDENINKININKVLERLNDIKHNMPDLLNTTEANPVLFKLNKYNELFNPLDECLQVEINNFNEFLTKLEYDINSLLSILKGEMTFVKKYYNIIQSINLNKVPNEWSLSKYPKENSEDLNTFMKKIKDRYNFFNKWIYDGLVKVYDLSFLSNDRLFITLLPLYFQKKLPEGKASSDKIKLYFKLTKYYSNTEITDEILEEYKKNNFLNEDFIFIKGLKLNGFECKKDEERDIIYLQENENCVNNINNLIPIISVTYEVEEYQYEEIMQKENEQSEYDDDDDDEEEIVEETNDNNNVEEEKKEKESDNKEEKTKNEREVETSKDNTKITQRIVIEETKTKAKKDEFLESMKNKSSINTETKDGFQRSMRIRTKTKTYRKHCRLDIPFCEEEAPESYNINEPYGYIEIRFNCEKDKQEEYFRNKQLKIELDK